MTRAANENRGGAELPELGIRMLEGGGFVVRIAGNAFAAFSNAAEMCAWLEANLQPVPATEDEQFPTVLQRELPQPQKRTLREKLFG